MVSTLVRFALGEVGCRILDLYRQNSLLVNGFVVLYGAFWTAARLNFKHLRNAAVEVLERRLEDPDRESAPADSGPAVGWEYIIEHESFFPFVATRSSFFPRRCSVETMDALEPIGSLTSPDKVSGTEGQSSDSASG